METKYTRVVLIGHLPTNWKVKDIGFEVNKRLYGMDLKVSEVSHGGDID